MQTTLSGMQELSSLLFDCVLLLLMSLLMSSLMFVFLFPLVFGRSIKVIFFSILYLCLFIFLNVAFNSFFTDDVNPNSESLHKVNEALIWNRYNRIPHPATDTKWEMTTNNYDDMK